MHPATRIQLAALLIAVASPAQSFTVVPAQYANTDANGICAIPGAADAYRHVTLVGASHLTSMVGQSIQAVSFRRSASDSTYQGGTIHLQVWLSATSTAPLDCSRAFADNVGAAPVLVFSGPVTVPTSPASPGPNAPWTPQNTVRIAFNTGFFYAGGTLCMDIVGSPVAGQEVDWWMTDAVVESYGGSTANLGGACGAFVGSDGNSAFLGARSLVAGGFIESTASGTPYGLAIAAFGQGTPLGTPLSLLGFAAQPGCDLHLATLDFLMAAVFVPDPDPALAGRGGEANLHLKIPATPAVFGHTMTTQWLDWTQMATSNAIEWTVGAQMPTLDMALITGDPASPIGRASPNRAHVLRFEWQ
ncbi:MAG TPA: hypothetical protein ENI87_14620 [bacterium]|nr:hypothetical protein [bacterium]